ncbi:sensor histidine kinase [Streptomyces sp. NPDC047821]|uniref:sensor histidine kinase n=1 Tax=Streptomyces sp. NPDC047821 TaxID=3365488 RepID=UPI00371D116C
MPLAPAASVLRRAAASPRAHDAVTAASGFALMLLDVPGLAAADNSLTGLTATLVLGAGAATLLVRRRAPWVPYAVALVLVAWLHELTLIQFALYSLGRFRGRRAGVPAAAGYLAVAYGMTGMPAALVVPIGVLATAVGVAAYRQDLVRELQVRRAETAALHAVHEERTSVARDVHDLVGRELTVLAVRAEVLARRARDTPHRPDFEELADTARRAHHMLNETIVRRAGDPGATPGLDALPALAAQSGRMGTPVELTVDAEAARVSPLRQAAVHRVVRECLTNAAKHAPGRPVTITVSVTGGAGPRTLRTEVRNALPDTPPEPGPLSTGTGLPSMRERVAAMGGTLTACRRGGVYEVVAVLPL